MIIADACAPHGRLAWAGSHSRMAGSRRQLHKQFKKLGDLFIP
jgi:hypothetical protein